VWRETEDFLDDEAAEERRRTKEERRALHAVILRVRMPAEDYNALLRLAMREGLAVSALARTVLRRFVADAKRRGPRRR